MNNRSPITIHEFSTGINPRKTNNGWLSQGFTGKYMNATLDRIPEEVERSIANREFALSEGSSSELPAIIGRVVGTGDKIWSVLAIVTRGRDEKGRSLSVYRYFLSEGGDRLSIILNWWEGKKPIFDPFGPFGPFGPFDIKTLHCPHSDIYPDSTPTSDISELSPDQTKPDPILLSPKQQYDLRTINSEAIKKSKSSKLPVSWAFNVEALEKPRSFLIIRPASQRAYDILERAIKQTPQFSTSALVDEEAIKSAIRGLINSSQVKGEAVKVITDALANQEMTLEHWHSLFDGQGAKTAIKQKIYSLQMVRLITLRAMVIPETLPEFLNWLDIQPRGKLKEHQTDCLKFQEKISKQIPPTQLSKGIKLLLIQLIEAKITPAAFKVLFMKGSAWGICQKEFINDIRYDLEIIAKHGDSPQSYQSFADDSLKNKPVWKKLISNWKLIKADYYKIPDYLPLAQLLEELKHYDLSAYFYQVSKRSVPKKVLSARNVKSSCLGLQLKPEVTLLDHVINFFSGGPIVPIKAVILITFILSGLTGLSGFFMGSQLSKTPKSVTKTSYTPTPTPTMPEKLLTAPIEDDKFKKTILITFILSGLTGLSGFFMGSQLSKTRNQNQAPSATTKSPTTTPTMPPQLLTDAIKAEKFKTTTSSIILLIDDLKKQQSDEKRIKEKLQEILAYENNKKDNKLDFIQKIDPKKLNLNLNDQQKRLLAQAIYNYQEKTNQKLQEILAYEDNKKGNKLDFIKTIDPTKPDLNLTAEEKQLLAQAIAIYSYQQKTNQDNTSQINGIIDENNFIYHQLKNDLKAKLQGN